MKSLILLLAGILFIGLPPAMAHKTGRKHMHHKRHHKTTYYYNQRTHGYSHNPKDAEAQRASEHRGNDGQRKNIQRNLNYGTGQQLPPNNGNGSGR